jgi:hypothetical protein
LVLVGAQATGNQSPFIDSGLAYNASTNTLSADNISVGSGTFATTNWTITEVAGKLTFSYLGAAKFSIDSSGNAVAAANVTAYDTP